MELTRFSREEYAQVLANPDAAEALYKRALKADPKNVFILASYAFLLANERKDPDAAEALYKRALEADPKNADTLGRYAQFLTHKRKDPDAAEALYKRALEIDPKNANNLGNYVHFLFANGQVEQAQTALNRVLTMLDPKRPTALNAECWMYAYCNNTSGVNIDALTELKRLIVEFFIKTGEWDFTEIIAQAIKFNHREAKWLPKLAEVLAWGKYRCAYRTKASYC